MGVDPQMDYIVQAVSLCVAAFSVATVDFYPQQGKHYPGGNALNQAARFAQMGHHTAFVGALGTDVPGDQTHALLIAESVVNAPFSSLRIRVPSGILGPV